MIIKTLELNSKETNFKFHPNSCKTLVTIRSVEIFLEKTRETKSKQVKQTGQLAAAAAPGLHEHDAVVCSLLLRRRRGRIRRRKKVVRSNVKFDVIFPEKD